MEFKRYVDGDARSIPTIEIAKYEPHPEKRGIVQLVGMRSYGEVFQDLQNHLEEMGMLPDEYFSDSYSWHHKDKEAMPEFSEAVCYVNFGGSEGIYLDVMLRLPGVDRLERFATGKTLGSTVEDFYRMSMICAECSLMLNGYGDHVLLGERDLSISFRCVDRALEAEQEGAEVQELLDGTAGRLGGDGVSPKELDEAYNKSVPD